MTPVQEALWFVESHFQTPIRLDDVAQVSGLSPFHLTRVFTATFGMSLMRYVRRRRLTEAAKQLAAGAPNILKVALDHGYGTHEAFSRAFKDEFGMSPERIRELGQLNQLMLLEPITMSKTPLLNLAPPRIENLPARQMAGKVERHECESPAGIPSQWQKFGSYLGRIPNQVGKAAYGVCYNFDDEGHFDYMTAVEVSRDEDLPNGLNLLPLSEQRYAVFRHGGHVAEIRGVISAIWNDGLAKAGFEPAHGPTLEKYGEEFNPATGLGGFEIWIAVR